MRRVLITGVNGFVGQHLARELHSRGCHIIGTGHSEPAGPSIADLLDEYVACNLTDETAVQAIDLRASDVVIHLAGLAAQGQSFDHPQKFIADNSAMVTNLLHHAVQNGTKARFVIVSSSSVYDTGGQLPITEDMPTFPASPYAISKLLVEQITTYYKTRGADCVIARPFNHTGPGQGPGYILPDLVAQVRAAVSASSDMQVGNLQTKRDYTDVRDVVRAYVELAVSPTLKHDMYNICSGRSVAGTELLDLLFDAMHLETRPAVVVDQTKVRPTDREEVRGSYERLQADTGWQPTIPLEQTVRDFVADAS